MTAQEMSEDVERFFRDANALQFVKNRDYHPDDVAFLEILRTACEAGISVEQDLWAKIRKQYVALRGFAIDKKLESESPRSRMTDIAVYMGMFSFWVGHRRQIVRDALRFIDSKTDCENPDYCGTADTHTMCDRCFFLVWLRNQ